MYLDFGQFNPTKVGEKKVWIVLVYKYERVKKYAWQAESNL